MGNDPKKIVNTEEQNRPVNPGDKNYGDDDQSQESPVNAKQDNPGEYEKPDSGIETDQPFRIEGDDASSIDRKRRISRLTLSYILL